jgi:large subunit ribosomal protein L32
VAVPKRKMSRSNTRSRRAQWKTTLPQLMACPNCREPKLPHTACPTCGQYNRRQVIAPS